MLLPRARKRLRAICPGVEITGTARHLAELEQTLDSQPAVDEARVAQVRAAIEQGRYKISPDRIADQLIQLERALGSPGSLSVDPGACRETLASLISQENRPRSRSLRSCSSVSTRFSLPTTSKALEAAMAERQGCVGVIVRVEEERRSMCRMMGIRSGSAGAREIARPGAIRPAR